SRDAIQKLGKLDENMTPFTTGIDIRMGAEELGISICNETSTCIELDSKNFLWPMDGPLHSFQWNEERVFDSLKGLEKKWGIHLQKQDYVALLKNKKRDLLESRNPLHFLAGIFSGGNFLNNEKPQLNKLHESLLAEAA
ncbi:MAG TPA: hypothetical protein VJC08_04465, partial [bacterium]|nr:hypothetical protein [bacterium]